MVHADSFSVAQKPPFSLSLSKGFDKLSLNGHSFNRIHVGINGSINAVSAN